MCNHLFVKVWECPVGCEDWGEDDEDMGYPRPIIRWQCVYCGQYDDDDGVEECE